MPFPCHRIVALTLILSLPFDASSQQADERTKLVTALRDAKSREEAYRLLLAQAKWVDRPLVASLIAHIEDLLRRQKLADAARLADIQGEAARMTRDPIAVALAHMGRAAVLETSGKPADAVRAYNEALALMLKDRNEFGEAMVRVSVVGPLMTLGRYEESLKHSAAGLALVEKLKEDEMLPVALNNHALGLKVTGKMDEAARIFERVRGMGQARKQPDVEGMANFNLGEVHWQRGRVEDARKAFEEARRIATRLNEPRMLAMARNGLGLSAMSAGKYAEARTELEAAFELFGKIGDVMMRLRASNNIGLVQTYQGEYSDALTRFSFLILLAKERNDEPLMLLVMGNVAELYRRQGKFGDALVAQTATLGKARQLKDAQAECRALHNLGTIFMSLGEVEKAIHHFQDAVVLAEKIGDRPQQASALMNLGIINQAFGDRDVARKQYTKCLETAKALGQHELSLFALLNLAMIDHYDKKSAEARKRLLEALALVEKTGERGIEAMIRRRLANIQRDLEQWEEAEKGYQKALAMLEDSSDLVEKVEALHGHALLHKRRADWKKAEDLYRRCIDGIEQLRLDSGESNLQTSLFQMFSFAYQERATCLDRLGRREEAFAASEQGKARTLIDILANGRVDISGALSEEHRKTEGQLKAALAKAQASQQQARTRGDEDDKTRAAREVSLARTNLEKYQQTLYLAHTDVRDARARYSAATLAQLDAGLFAAEPGMVLLSYHVGSEETLLFVVSRDPKAKKPDLEIHRIGIGREELTAKVRRLRHACSSGLNYETLAEEVYTLLIKPATPRLTGKTHLAVLPDGPLHTLPFAVLIDEKGKHLIERYSLSSGPSATALVKMKELGDKRDRDMVMKPTSLVLGRPVMPAEDFTDLPHSAEEANVVAKLLGTVSATGKEASELHLKRDIGNARYVHIASHGRTNGAAPMHTHIALTKGDKEDGLLYAHELVGLKLTARLVVLSACDTASKGLYDGEGLLGLGWALFVAGSPSNLLTLWAIDDGSTSKLMKEFYLRFAPSGEKGIGAITRAEALQQAQLKLLADEKTKHPSHWAAFVLVGDWRR